MKTAYSLHFSPVTEMLQKLDQRRVRKVSSKLIQKKFVTFPYFTFAFLLLTLGVARHASGAARHTSGIIVFIAVALLLF